MSGQVLAETHCQQGNVKGSVGIKVQGSLTQRLHGIVSDCRRHGEGYSGGGGGFFYLFFSRLEKFLGECSFIPHSCQDSNSQSFDHKSGALPTSYPGSCRESIKPNFHHVNVAENKYPLSCQVVAVVFFVVVVVRVNCCWEPV